MKRIFVSIFLILCGSILIGQDNCSKAVVFGGKDICLPKVAGYNECYEYPRIKTIADLTEVDKNKVLGYYINDADHADKEAFGNGTADDFFKVYGTKAIEHLPADESALSQMESLLKSNFIVESWDKITDEIGDLSIGDFIEVGKPKLINNYRLNDESFSCVMLIRYNVEGIEPYTMAMTMNGLLLNERLVWLAYYQLYEGESTIQKLQERNNFIVNSILKSNS